METVRLFGKRLLIQAVETQAAMAAAAQPRLPMPGIPFVQPRPQFYAEADYGSYGKGQVVAIGEPLPEDEADGGDVLGSETIGGSEGGPFTDGFLQMMTKFFQQITNQRDGRDGPDIMPPVQKGDIVVFNSHVAVAWPDDPSLLVVPGGAIVAVVTVEDFATKGAAGGV